jgi:hypothetical protein
VAANAASKIVAWTYDIAKPAPDLKLGAGAIQLERYWPWNSSEAFDGYSEYRLAPSGTTLLPDTRLRSEALAAPKNFRLPDLQLESHVSNTVNSKRIYFHLVVPRGVTTIQGSILAEAPDVGATTELSPLFYIKDSPSCRLAAVLFAYALSMVLFLANTRLRQTLLHRGTRAKLTGRLTQFLATRPDLANLDSVTFARELIAESDAADRAGQVDLADSDLQAAAGRIDGVIASPPQLPVPPVAGAVPAAPAEPAIRIAHPPAQQTANRSLKLIVTNPPADWAGPRLIHWDFGHQQPVEGMNLLSIRHAFPQGSVTVTVSAEGSHNLVTRTVAIGPPPQPGFLVSLRAIDYVTHGTGMLLAVLTAYAATSAADAWGTSGDYISLLATAFSVGTGVQGLRAVITAVRG